MRARGVFDGDKLEMDHQYAGFDADFMIASGARRAAREPQEEPAMTSINPPEDATYALIRELFFAQGQHLHAMLSPVDFTTDPFYTSDDTLDYLDAATDLFHLMIDFFHNDRDPNELTEMLNTPGLFAYRYACDGVSPIFDRYPCMTDAFDLDHDALQAALIRHAI